MIDVGQFVTFSDWKITSNKRLIRKLTGYDLIRKL